MSKKREAAASKWRGSDALVDQLVAIDRLVEDPGNLNKHPARSIEQIAKSLDRFGQVKPVVVRRDGKTVIAGNGTLAAARSLGWTSLAVVKFDGKDEDAAAYAIVDNRSAQFAEWDHAALLEKISALPAIEQVVLGWNDDEVEALARLVSDSIAPVAADADPPAVAKVADAHGGGRYQLGPHVLVCGDSLLPETLDALFVGSRPACAMWTDPPYGVSYVGKTQDAMTIENDDKDPVALEAFIVAVSENAMRHMEPGSPTYQAAPAGPLGATAFANALMKVGLFRQRLVWVKDRFVLGHSDYHYRHEDIFMGYTPGAKGRLGRGGSRWYGDDAQDTILEVARPSANLDHPTMKPVELIERCLANSTRVGDVVLDPFGGSGSTLIACARMNRVARLVEIDPLYADVIRRRWTAWAKAAGVDPGSGALD